MRSWKIPIETQLSIRLTLIITKFPSKLILRHFKSTLNAYNLYQLNESKKAILTNILNSFFIVILHSQCLFRARHILLWWLSFLFIVITMRLCIMANTFIYFLLLRQFQDEQEREKKFFPFIIVLLLLEKCRKKWKEAYDNKNISWRVIKFSFQLALLFFRVFDSFLFWTCAKKILEKEKI